MTMTTTQYFRIWGFELNDKHQFIGIFNKFHFMYVHLKIQCSLKISISVCGTKYCDFSKNKCFSKSYCSPEAFCVVFNPTPTLICQYLTYPSFMLPSYHDIKIFSTEPSKSTHILLRHSLQPNFFGGPL